MKAPILTLNVAMRLSKFILEWRDKKNLYLIHKMKSTKPVKSKNVRSTKVPKLYCLLFYLAGEFWVVQYQID